MMYILYKVVCDLSTRNHRGSFETGVSRKTLIKSGRCSKVSGQQVSRLSLADGNRLNENAKISHFARNDDTRETDVF